jgi:AraC-like DNA-binding protein
MSPSLKATLVCLMGAMAMLPRAASAGDPETPKVDRHAQDQAEVKRKTLMADATNAIRETQNALKQLDDGKKKPAIEALERATGKLEIILARDPSLTLAPTDVHVSTVDMQGGVDAVKKLAKQADDLIRDGRLQEARRLLAYAASETVVSVTNIPLATYPQALKGAAKLIDEDKTKEAKHILQTALDTQVVTETIIPLPVHNAGESLTAAETLAEKNNRSKDENARLKASLDRARSQLELAQALGYGTQSDFKVLYQQLTDIENKTADNKFGTGLFAKIKTSLSELLKSSQPARHPGIAPT